MRFNKKLHYNFKENISIEKISERKLVILLKYRENSSILFIVICYFIINYHLILDYAIVLKNIHKSVTYIYVNTFA